MKTRRPLAFLFPALLALLMSSGAATAQSTWNRHAEAVALTAGAAGGIDVEAVFEIHLEGSHSTTLDLGTTVDLSLNGTVIASQTVPVSSDPGAGAGCLDGGSCGGGCGTGQVDGASVSLLCLAEGACGAICDCTCKFPSIQANFPGIPSAPGDELMILLRPSPGALPETNPADDTLAVTYSGSPLFWDRRVTGLTLVETAGGPDSFFDIWVDVEVFHEGLLELNGTGGASVDLGMDIELQIDGAVHATHTLPFAPQPTAPTCSCGNSCGLWLGAAHFCEPYDVGVCHCGWSAQYIFPAVPVDPGQVAKIVLKPTPGALPELPGFDEDDEREDTCCPRPTGVADVLPESGALRQNSPNPFRRGTSIAFGTATSQPVRLEVFDLRGRRVRTLLDRDGMEPGNRHIVAWDGRDGTGHPAAPGLYFYRLTADGRTQTKKMTLAP